MTTLKVPHPTQSRSTYYAWLIQNCYSHYDRTCMVVCSLDGLQLDATLPLQTLLLGQTHAYCYISLLILLLRLYDINAWWKLVLSGLWGECCVCDLCDRTAQFVQDQVRLSSLNTLTRAYSHLYKPGSPPSVTQDLGKSTSQPRSRD